MPPLIEVAANQTTPFAVSSEILFLLSLLFGDIQNATLDMRYICTNCASPTPTLYKVYSTPGSIQLTTCKGCGNDVDPYIEREWLLVFMDCVLHRHEAYRHVLYNREPFSKIGVQTDSHQQHGVDSDGDNESSDFCLRHLLRYTFIASLIRTYFWHAATEGEETENSQENNNNLAVLLLVLVQSFVGEIIMAIATITFSAILVRTTSMGKGRGNNSSKDAKHSDISSSLFFYSRLYLAVTIPSFFYFVTIFALIWENSTTVCMLGTLFVLSLQRIAVATVVDERLKRVVGKVTKSMIIGENAVSLRVKQSIPLVLGVIAKSVSSHIAMKMLSHITYSIDYDGIQCSGISLQSSSFGSFCIS